MKRKVIKIIIGLMVSIIVVYGTYVFVGTRVVENLMWEHLNQSGYMQTEIQSITVKHSLEVGIIYNKPWTISVVYTDEPESTYFYTIREGSIVEDGVSGTTEKVDTKHLSKP